MRCRKKILVLVVIGLLLGSLYLISHPESRFDVLTSTKGVPVWAFSQQRLEHKKSWLDQGDYLHLNVSYQLLAGRSAQEEKFLTVGLASVKRINKTYLLSTLQLIFSQSSQEELSDMVVVVLLADFDAHWRQATVGEIKDKFTPQLAEGQLLIIHVPQVFYPPLTGLKRNYNDAPDRVSFRSKQNVDYSFLINYSISLSQYYIQVEDDVYPARNFLSSIRKHVYEQNQKNAAWATLEFSSLGYIGKLYQSIHLPLLARFLLLFYQEMPCDWLLTHFRVLLTQREQILFKPSLFQHVGTISSFQGNFNKLRDKDFEGSSYLNPSADVFTNMSTYKDHIPSLAWAPGEGFFWGRSPETGNYLTVVFKRPTIVSRIIVETGLEGKDFLNLAVVELGYIETTTDKGEKSCDKFHVLGDIENGRFEVQEVDKTYGVPSSCVRIRVIADQKDWVIINKIRIVPK